MKKTLLTFVLFAILMAAIIILNKVCEWNLNLIVVGTIMAIVYFYTAIKLIKK